MKPDREDRSALFREYSVYKHAGTKERRMEIIGCSEEFKQSCTESAAQLNAAVMLHECVLISVSWCDNSTLCC